VIENVSMKLAGGFGSEAYKNLVAGSTASPNKISLAVLDPVALNAPVAVSTLKDESWVVIVIPETLVVVT
jgi:hypothetical protein